MSISNCTQINSLGGSYEEIGCLYPFLGKFYTKFELEFDPLPSYSFLADRPWIPIVAVIFYLAAIVFGQAYFRNRDPWNWRGALAVWNLALAVFSTIGFIRVLPIVLHDATHYSLFYNVCADKFHRYAPGTSGIWGQLFMLSKMPELLDTFFIIIHKKKLIFLHWYHHVTVLLFSWHCFFTKAPLCPFFACMNYGVHSIMYFYYFLMAVRKRPKWFKPMIITTLQIAQMVGGVCLTALGYAYMGTEGCTIQRQNVHAGMIMYGSYLFLFVQFFVKRYFKVTESKNKSD